MLQGGNALLFAAPIVKTGFVKEILLEIGFIEEMKST